MLINACQKVLGVIAQWLNVTADIIYPRRTPVRIRIQNPEELKEYKFQKYNSSRDQSTSNYNPNYKPKYKR